MPGEGGASAEMKEKLVEVQARYDSLKAKVNDAGINGFVFSSKIPVHKKHEITQKTEDEQVQALVDGKKAFSAGGQWAVIGMQLLGSHAIIKAQRLQLKKEKEGGEANAAKKLASKMEKANKAQEALTLYRAAGKMNRSHWDAIIRFLWPRLDSNAAPSKLTSINK